MYILLFSFFFVVLLIITCRNHRLAHLPVREALEVEAKDYD